MSKLPLFELSARDCEVLTAVLTGSNRSIAFRSTNEELGLPPAALDAVLELLSGLAAGSAVRILADDRDLTTQEVADLLGLSRTFVARLIDNGKLPAHLAGTHRRVRSGDAIAYKQQRASRLAAVSAIADADRAAGVSYR